MSPFLTEEAPWRNVCAHFLDELFPGGDQQADDEPVSHEFEVRFGHFESKSKEQDRAKFHGGISFNAYRRLLDRHKTGFPMFYVESEHMLQPTNTSTTVHIDQDRQRAIEKKMIDRLDVAEWGLRFQASKETELKPSEYSDVLRSATTTNCIKRQRKRHSIWLIANEWRLDVTEVNTVQPGDICGTISWEAELEFTGQFSLAESGFTFTSQLCHILFPLLQIVQDSFFPINNDKYRSLQKTMATYRATYPFLGLTQPRAMNRQDLAPKKFENMSATPYGVTLKADGERALILFDEQHSAFLYTVIDGWRQLPLDPNNEAHKRYAGTVIDGEYDGHRFHAFDLIALNGIVVGDTIKHDLSERLLILDQIRKDTNSMFEVKEYMYFQTFDALTAAANHLLNKAETQGPFTIDGLVFTPTTMFPNYKTKTWAAQWKWKIQPTIDLMFAYDPSESALYASCAKINEDDSGLIIFNPVDTNLHPGRVAEFAWLNNRLTFVRLRPDKTAPNFITVATDILQSFRDQITRGMITGKVIRLPSVPKVPTISKKSKDSTNKKLKLK